MRPIDFCTPKPFPLEHSCFSSLPSAAVCSRTKAFRHPPEDHSRSGTLRLRARPRQRLLGTLLRPSEDARNRHREARAARCRRDWGESRFTARFPLQRPVPTCGAAFSSASREGYRSPLTPLSPPPGSYAWAAFSACPMLWLEGRQDRFRGGLVKGVRIPDPGCLPSAVTTHTPPVPKHERNRVAFIDRDGAHVMRIAELR